ncbi:MAG: chemotaxis protein CheC [Eubacteriales bacterium]|nr:chemotaxis protein CheC [Eubacteriales bacterium]
MFDICNIKKNELDFFQELENIGASHAATALSVMLGRTISLRVPCVQFCEYKKICDILKGPENLVAGLLVGISDDLNGFILLVLDNDDAYNLSGSVISDIEAGAPGSDFSELQTSALKEIANILIGSYITAISSLTGLKMNASVPELVIDMAGAIMNLLTSAYGEYGDAVLFLETEFVDEAQSIFGHFFLIPDVNSYKILIEKMGIG